MRGILDPALARGLLVCLLGILAVTLWAPPPPSSTVTQEKKTKAFASLPREKMSNDTPVSEVDSTPEPQPVIRVGLLEDYDRVSFQVSGPFAIEDLKGKVLRPMKASELKWRLSVEEAVPTQFLYSVLVVAFPDEANAIALAESLEKGGLHAYVRPLGEPVEINGEILRDNRRFRVQVGNFLKSEEAEKLLPRFSDDYSPRVVRELMQRVSGRIEIFDANLSESLTVNDGLRIVPSDLTVETKIFGVRVGTGFRWEKEEDRAYSGIVEFRLDHEGKLGAISEIPIDVYLRGVVPAEMPAGFPMEALKAQAVAARSEVLAKLHTKHLNDPFDVCATEHCQVYAGVTPEDPRSNEAVIETSGEVLMRDGSLVDAVYSAVCGGHTEDAALVWSSPHPCAPRGVWCCAPQDTSKINLSTEEGARQWIMSKPNVFCNVPTTLLPVAPDYTRRHFRWEVTYNRQELEKIIAHNTSQDIGTLYEILPVERGVSGRLMQIEILGSRKNLKIKSEIKIRRVLSATMLESSCFVVDIEQDEQGLPAEITITGAGWGHGAGMCQVGAAHLALQGKTYQEILVHYYPASAVIRWPVPTPPETSADE
jgi:peptidoglycan hydrolase-like amidase